MEELRGPLLPLCKSQRSFTETGLHENLVSKLAFEPFFPQSLGYFAAVLLAAT